MNLQFFKFHFLLLYLCSIPFLFAQQGIGTNQPDPSSALEVSSTDKGFLIPRMTTAQRNAINAPTLGLLIFNTDILCVEINTSSVTTAPLWECLKTGLLIVSADYSNTLSLGSDGGAYLASDTLEDLIIATVTVVSADASNTLSLGTDGGAYLSSDTLIADGTTASNTLRWDGTAWVESNTITNNGVDAVVVSAGLTVDGAAHNNEAFYAGAGTTIDFAQSNFAYTTASAGAFTLNNLKDGGAYTLAVQGATSGTSTFTATGFTFKSKDAATATDADTHSIYSFIVLGNTVYYTLVTGL